MIYQICCIFHRASKKTPTVHVGQKWGRQSNVLSFIWFQEFHEGLGSIIVFTASQIQYAVKPKILMFSSTLDLDRYWIFLVFQDILYLHALTFDMGKELGIFVIDYEISSKTFH